MAIARSLYTVSEIADKDSMEKVMQRQFVQSLGKISEWVDAPCPQTPVPFEEKQLAESMLFAVANAFVHCEHLGGAPAGAKAKTLDKTKWAGDFRDFMTSRFKAAKKKYLPAAAANGGGANGEVKGKAKTMNNRGCGLSALKHDHVTDKDKGPAWTAANKVFDVAKGTVDKLMQDGVGDGEMLTATAITTAMQLAVSADASAATTDAKKGVKEASSAMSTETNIGVAGEAVGTGLTVLFAFMDPTGISAAAAITSSLAGTCKIGQAQKEKHSWNCIYCPVLQNWCQGHNKKRRAKNKLPYWCGDDVDSTAKYGQECKDTIKIKHEVCPTELTESCNFFGTCKDANASCKPDPEDKKKRDAWEAEFKGGMAIGVPPVNYRCECHAGFCSDDSFTSCKKHGGGSSTPSAMVAPKANAMKRGR
eukprot:g3525.t1